MGVKSAKKCKKRKKADPLVQATTKARLRAAHENGYNKGYDKGYDTGEKTGYALGSAAGEKTGHERGLLQGQEETRFKADQNERAFVERVESARTLYMQKNLAEYKTGYTHGWRDGLKETNVSVSGVYQQGRDRGDLEGYERGLARKARVKKPKKKWWRRK